MGTNMKIISTESDYETAMAAIDRLLDGDPAAGTADGHKLEVLVDLVEEYEHRIAHIGLPDPVSAIEFRMEQQGLR